MEKSKFLGLNWKDFAKGLFVALIGAFLGAITEILNAGKMPDIDTLKTAGITALAVGVSYLLKNLLTNSNDQILKKES